MKGSTFLESYYMNSIKYASKIWRSKIRLKLQFTYIHTNSKVFYYVNSYYFFFFLRNFCCIQCRSYHFLNRKWFYTPPSSLFYMWSPDLFLYIKIFNKCIFENEFKFYINFPVVFLIIDKSFINIKDFVFIVYLLGKTHITHGNLSSH